MEVLHSRDKLKLGDNIANMLASFSSAYAYSPFIIILKNDNNNIICQLNSPPSSACMYTLLTH